MSDAQHPEQIKSRERVRELAEVYTHQREVVAMLDLVPDMFPSSQDPENADRTFLEPACGSGNFLVEVLRRKLRFVTPQRYRRGEVFEYWLLRCVASIYGIDISEDNIKEARERMRSTVAAHVEEHELSLTAGCDEALSAILFTNIVCADALADAAKIELVEYAPTGDGTFVREWARPLDPVADELSLFAPSSRRDEIPVHYSALARQNEPTRHDSAGRNAA